ncbi:MAG: hypothetical protein LAT82_03995 [Nanoarchaeota archaeon]|nr:hypothetical protein [Nanoarchaeota archaeon]
MSQEIQQWIEEQKQHGYSKKELIHSLIQSGQSKKKAKKLLKGHFKKSKIKILFTTLFIILLLVFSFDIWMKYSLFKASELYIEEIDKNIYENSLNIYIVLNHNFYNKDVFQIERFITDSNEDFQAYFYEWKIRYENYFYRNNESKEFRYFFGCDVEYNCDYYKYEFDYNSKEDLGNMVLSKIDESSFNIYFISITEDNMFKNSTKNYLDIEYVNAINQKYINLLKDVSIQETPEINYYNLFNYYNSNNYEILKEVIIDRIKLLGLSNEVLNLARKSHIIPFYENISDFTNINYELKSIYDNQSKITYFSSFYNTTYTWNRKNMLTLDDLLIRKRNGYYKNNKNIFYNYYRYDLIDGNYLNFYYQEAKITLLSEIINKSYEKNSIDETLRLLTKIIHEFNSDQIYLNPITFEFDDAVLIK